MPGGVGGATLRGVPPIPINPESQQALKHGARAVVYRTRRKHTPGAWIAGVLMRRPFNVAAVALADKTARIAWAIMVVAKPTARQPEALTHAGFGNARAFQRVMATRSDRDRHSPLALSHQGPQQGLHSRPDR